MGLLDDIEGLEKKGDQVKHIKDWMNGTEKNAKQINQEVDSKKDDKGFLKGALDKVNGLIKTGDQHKNTLSNLMGALHGANAFANLAGNSGNSGGSGGQKEGISAHIQDIAQNIQRLQGVLEFLKTIKEKITGFLAHK